MVDHASHVSGAWVVEILEAAPELVDAPALDPEPRFALLRRGEDRVGELGPDRVAELALACGGRAPCGGRR